MDEFSYEPEWSVAPNPTAGAVEIRFTNPFSLETSLDVFDSMGVLVQNLLPAALRVGEQRVIWQTASSAKGVYFLRLMAGGKAVMRKVVVY